MLTREEYLELQRALEVANEAGDGADIAPSQCNCLPQNPSLFIHVNEIPSKTNGTNYHKL